MCNLTASEPGILEADAQARRAGDRPQDGDGDQASRRARAEAAGAGGARQAKIPGCRREYPTAAGVRDKNFVMETVRRQ